MLETAMARREVVNCFNIDELFVTTRTGSSIGGGCEYFSATRFCWLAALMASPLSRESNLVRQSDGLGCMIVCHR